MLPPYPLSWALACASRTAHVRSNSSSSFITVLCQVVFGLPLVFLFSVGAHLMATSNILSEGIFRTWTRHHGLGANHLTSEGGYGRFKKKKYPALKKISRMADNAGKKILHRWMLGRKFFLQSFGEKNPYPNQITHTPHQKSKGRPLIPYFGLQGQ